MDKRTNGQARRAARPGTPANTGTKERRPPPRDINAAQRAAVALQLRAQKLPYEEIARRCGYASRSAAYRAIQREMDRTIVANVEQLRQEEMLLLDQLQAEVYALAFDRENRSRLFAIDRLLQISDRRCRLMGLDRSPDDAQFGQVVIREVPAGYLAVATAAPASPSNGAGDPAASPLQGEGGQA
jgi:AraC-like DNA-binding protein